MTANTIMETGYTFVTACIGKPSVHRSINGNPRVTYICKTVELDKG